MWQEYLKFIEAVGVFPKLDHATKDQYSSAFTDEAMGSTARWDVTPHRGQEPLLRDWKNEQMQNILVNATFQTLHTYYRENNLWKKCAVARHYFMQNRILESQRLKL